jgi:hypothetical protein
MQDERLSNNITDNIADNNVLWIQNAMPKKAAALLHASSLPTQLDILVENAGLSPMVTTAKNHSREGCT